MNLLEKIVKAKRADIEMMKEKFPVASLERRIYFTAETLSLERSLENSSNHGIIAEFKRQSPSRGVINEGALPEDVCPRYLRSGAAAVSILTDSEFFGGSNDDLTRARKSCNAPILRKDFIISEYQVLESKSIGADAILLIADILSEKELKSLSRLAESLKMEVLFEIHEENGIRKLPGNARLTGINSRNLGNFSIDMSILRETLSKLPDNAIGIAESGIHSAETLIELESLGFKGFLIGELFMKEKDPGEAFNRFITNINKNNSVK